MLTVKRKVIRYQEQKFSAFVSRLTCSLYFNQSLMSSFFAHPVSCSAIFLFLTYPVCYKPDNEKPHA